MYMILNSTNEYRRITALQPMQGSSVWMNLFYSSSPVCEYHCTQLLYTAQHSSDNIHQADITVQVEDVIAISHISHSRQLKTAVDATCRTDQQLTVSASTCHTYSHSSCTASTEPKGCRLPGQWLPASGHSCQCHILRTTLKCLFMPLKRWFYGT